jgi:LEA14-like dessication related protein
MEDPVLNGIENIKLSKLGFGTTVMAFDVRYFNPNKTKAKLMAAEGEAWFDSSYIGHFHVDTIVNIPAKADFTIPVRLDVDTKAFLKYSFSKAKNEDVMITVNGKARVGKGGIFKSIPLHFEAKKNLAQLIN